eukprot:PhF_6_TR36545/c0_g1_i3/m.53902
MLIALVACCVSVIVTTPVESASTPAFTAAASPIWHPTNTSSHYTYFRSPEFVLPFPIESSTSALLRVTAEQSPNVAGLGSWQSKLLGAFKLHINGIALAAGPGHNVPFTSQSVLQLDLLNSQELRVVLRNPPATNVIAFSCYFTNSFGNVTLHAEVPRLQAELVITSVQQEQQPFILSTNTQWSSLAADTYHNPGADEGHSWYHVLQENMNTQHRPTGWTLPSFHPPPTTSLPWVPAVVQPPFPRPFYIESMPAPRIYWRKACRVEKLPSGDYLLDYGKEFLGGVNLTFAVPNGTFGEVQIRIKLGEELLPNNQGVMTPTRAFENYTSVWTLDTKTSGNNVGIYQHEFIQFRYAQVSDYKGLNILQDALAWVVQHPMLDPHLNTIPNPY